MTIGDDRLNPGKSSLFEVFEQSRPEFFILAVGDSRTQDLPVAVVPDTGATTSVNGGVTLCTFGGLKVYTC